MIKHLRSSLLFACALALSATSMIGCKSVPVDVLSVSAPDSLLTNEQGAFAATINEDAKQPVSYQWSFDDGDSATGNPVNHAFGEAGTYTVSVTATNRKGKSSDTESTRVVVYNPPVPAEVISINANPMTPDTRTAVSFSANVRGDMPVTYAWDFGDGSSRTGATPTHTYGQPGTYTVSLTATNAAGSDTRTMALTVAPYEAAICREITEMNSAFFNRNSSTLTNEARAALADNLAILQECPNLSVRIEGVAAPGERNAQQLSSDRARAVEQYYVDGDISASRINAVGVGRAQGVTSKKEGTSQYRRADSIPMR